jgi:hypothetical protein
MYGFCNLSKKKTVYSLNVIDITDVYVEKNKLVRIICLILNPVFVIKDEPP